MKKALILLILLVSLSLTGCSKQKDIYKEQILAIESNYEKKIISKSGLYYKGEEKLCHRQIAEASQKIKNAHTE